MDVQFHKTAAELAQIVDGDVCGDGSVVISGFAGIKEARAGDLTFLANPKYLPLLKSTKASAVMVHRQAEADHVVLIKTDDPSLAFSKIISRIIGLDEEETTGVHPTAVIHEEADIGDQVSIGPFVVIEKGAVVGAHSRIMAGTFVGRRSRIGEHALIYPNVSIREGVSIGSRVIIHCGTVVGSDGFGFANVGGVQEKIPQIGSVVIGDDVEIGANVTIDRARFEKTVIGRGTKIDNLVQIAHNVRIGEDCVIVSHVGISGSTRLGNRVVLAGQVGVAGHLTIGEGAVVAAQSGVSKSVRPGAMMFGTPAKPMNDAKRVNAVMQRLPEYVKMIKDLKLKVQELENKLN